MRHPVKRAHADWARGDGADFWRGHVEGASMDTGVTVLFFATGEIGGGARLHVHPYDEVFIVREGRALYTIGGRQIEAAAGDVLMAPAGVAHKFRNLGPGRLETTDIHLSDRWVQTDLPDPDGD